MVAIVNGGGGDVKPLPTSFSGEVDMGKVITKKEIKIFWTRPKTFARPA